MLTDAWTPVWGGGQTHVWEVSQGLVRDYGYNVDVIVPNLVGKSGKKYPSEEKYLGGMLRVVRLGVPFAFPSIVGRLAFIKSLTLYCLSCGYDIYHSHSYSTSFVLPIVKFLNHGRIIFTLHGIGEKGLGAGIFNLFGLPRLLSNIFIYKLKYDALISVAAIPFNKRLRTKSVAIIGNGVTTEKFDLVKGSRSLKYFRFLWVGRFVPVKGLSNLLEIAPKLVAKFPFIQFKLVGDGQEKENILRIIKYKRLGKYIFVDNAKFGTDLIKEYKSANAYILPSIAAEGFPISVVEAMAAKLPVIASDLGDTRLLVQNGKTGYLVTPGDKHDLEKKIIRLIASTQQIKMGINGYNLVNKQFSWKLIVKQINKIYLSVLNPI